MTDKNVTVFDDFPDSDPDDDAAIKQYAEEIVKAVEAFGLTPRSNDGRR